MSKRLQGEDKEGESLLRAVSSDGVHFDPEHGKNLTSSDSKTPTTKPEGTISSTGLKVLILLAVQNSSKNLLMRYVLKEKPKFLTSAAVIGSECTKLTLSMLYILLVERKGLDSIITYFKDDWKNTIFVAVPASSYNIQMSLEYIALANLDAAMFR